MLFLVIMATNNKPYSCTIGMEPIIDLIKHTRTFIFLVYCEMPINARADGQVVSNVKISSFSGRHQKHLKSGSERSKLGRYKEKISEATLTAALATALDTVSQWHSFQCRMKRKGRSSRCVTGSV